MLLGTGRCLYPDLSREARLLRDTSVGEVGWDEFGAVWISTWKAARLSFLQQ